ncbi:MAG: DUF4340 domain-containing protein [Chloroflexi bacterium]|nr:DUF4340 domain-containing protein [Chloroflexota bacterium]
MRFRTTYILLAILVALAAFVFLWERKQPAPETAEATPLPTSVPPITVFDSTAVRSLRITRRDTGELAELAYRDSGLWHLTAPVVELADQQRVSSLVQTLSAITPSRLLPTGADPADYDLDPGLLLVETELQDGSRRTLRFGAQTPSSNGYYFQVDGDTSIYIVSYYLRDELTQVLSDPPIAPTPTVTQEPAPETTPAD